MVDVCDNELYAHAARVSGQVVLITGAGSGFGKGVAFEFAKYGSKVVLGDVNADCVKATADAIVDVGGEAVWRQCDVRDWDQQVALFQAGFEAFGRIDIVIANAGIREIGGFMDVMQDENGLPQKPVTDTLDVNLTGVLYTTRLGIYYLGRTPESQRAARAIIHIGSMASMAALPGGVMYTAAKTALLGLLPGLHASLHHQNIRTGVVCPWFSDTGIMTDAGRAFLQGVPLAPVPRVVGAIFRAASDAEETSDGCVWTIPDDGEVCRVPREHMQLVGGVYTVLNERLARTGPRKKWSDATPSVSKDLAPRLVGSVVSATPVSVVN
ncbi:NAD(P)-binding protein [Exidia glandulosa HHB12029]|uniref:NAD(P)-binding protein n=1 Tax=Exidia glandulosa HHB12029 TaxID=1314781 RepID=A0A166B1B4_EXIGL|nr:NAD(P)-binding protein [Exidia glandulosa HHB12029]